MLAILFLLFPLIELIVLIKAGGVIGALPAVVGAIATSILGASLLRRKGLRALLAMQNLEQGVAGADRKLAGDLAATLGAALLLFPGYVSDFFGVLFFVPGLGAFLLRRVLRGRQWTVVSSRFRREGQAPSARQGRVIEGEVTSAKPRNDRHDEP